jgi:two-component system chemotaxis response regulator CheB
METRRLINATCPECRGPLTEVANDGIVEYTCLIGHRYSPRGLLIAHSETQERALWAATLALQEAQVLADEVAPHLGRDGDVVRRQGKHKRDGAEAIRNVIDEWQQFQLSGTEERLEQD